MERVLTVYRCMNCWHKFRRTHYRGEPEPACPKCAHQPPPIPDRIAAPMIVGTKSKAVDEAYKIAEQDFGLTNLRSNAKEGEASFIAPPTPKPDPRTITSPTMLWGGAGPANGPLQMPSQAASLSAARSAAALARAEGKNPMQMLHKGRPKLQAIPINRE